jgi:hypothetical protein
VDQGRPAAAGPDDERDPRLLDPAGVTHRRLLERQRRRSARCPGAGPTRRR